MGAEQLVPVKCLAFLEMMVLESLVSPVFLEMKTLGNLAFLMTLGNLEIGMDYSF